MNTLLRKLSKQKWRAVYLSILIFISIIAYFGASALEKRAEEINKVEWIDIGHVTYVLPLFTGDQWLYRYDVRTNHNGNVTLRENGLPVPNIYIHLQSSLVCSYASFFPPLKVNQTVGITYYPACGYFIVIQN